MSNLITYIRKNIVFVILLSILLLITIGAGIFLWMDHQASLPAPAPAPSPDPVVEEVETSISSLEGSYSKNGEVQLTWSIYQGTHTVSSVRLFYGDKDLAGELKALTSYSLSQSLYQFPTGNTTFTLKAVLDNQEVITKEVTVFIDYIVDMNMTSEQSENTLTIHLTYRYDDANPVSIPRIKYLHSASLPLSFQYVDTTRQSTQGFTTATTTYTIDISNVKQGSYEATIRWIFDGINMSRDYPITIKR